jgi:hypothetical protein
MMNVKYQVFLVVFFALFFGLVLSVFNAFGHPLMPPYLIASKSSSVYIPAEPIYLNGSIPLRCNRLLMASEETFPPNIFTISTIRILFHGKGWEAEYQPEKHALFVEEDINNGRKIAFINHELDFLFEYANTGKGTSKEWYANHKYLLSINEKVLPYINSLLKQRRRSERNLGDVFMDQAKRILASKDFDAIFIQAQNEMRKGVKNGK